MLFRSVKWENVCLPKDFGGLGITNTRVLNEALLLKWVWRLYRNDEGDTCCQLLKNKYLKGKPISICKGGRSSHFWKGINKIKHLLDWGASFTVNNGKNTRFWEDVWINQIPLKLAFPKLYEFSYAKNCTVSDYFVGGEWNIPLRRSLGATEVKQWEELLLMLEDVKLNDNTDQIHGHMKSLGSTRPDQCTELDCIGGGEYSNAESVA